MLNDEKKLNCAAHDLWERRANFQNFLFPPEAKTLARGLYSLTISNWDGVVKVIQLRRKMFQFKRWIAAM